MQFLANYLNQTGGLTKKKIYSTRSVLDAPEDTELHIFEHNLLGMKKWMVWLLQLQKLTV